MTEGQERIVFSGEVDAQGHVKPERVNETRGRLAKWKGRKVTVTVQRFVKMKTNPQLNTFHGPVLEAWCDYTGYDPDEMKKELKKAWLVPQLEIASLTGEEITVLPSLADLNTEQMSAFLDRCIREGAQRGIEFALDRSSAGI